MTIRYKIIPIKKTMNQCKLNKNRWNPYKKFFNFGFIMLKKWYICIKLLINKWNKFLFKTYNLHTDKKIFLIYAINLF